MSETTTERVGRALENIRSHARSMQKESEVVAFVDSRLQDFRDGEGVITRRDAEKLSILLSSVASGLRVSSQQVRGWADEMEDATKPGAAPPGGSVLRLVGASP